MKCDDDAVMEPTPTFESLILDTLSDIQEKQRRQLKATEDVKDHIYRMEQLMTDMASDQAHLDADVQAFTTTEAQLVQVIADLVDQRSQNPSAPASSLNWAAADALVAKTQADAAQAEAEDAPPAETTIPAVPEGTDDTADTTPDTSEDTNPTT